MPAGSRLEASAPSHNDAPRVIVYEVQRRVDHAWERRHPGGIESHKAPHALRFQRRIESVVRLSRSSLDEDPGFFCD